MLLPLYYIHFEITILKQIRNIYLEKFNYSGSTELYIVLYIIHNILRKVEFGAFLISSSDWLTMFNINNLIGLKMMQFNH